MICCANLSHVLGQVRWQRKQHAVGFWAQHMLCIIPLQADSASKFVLPAFPSPMEPAYCHSNTEQNWLKTGLIS